MALWDREKTHNPESSSQKRGRKMELEMNNLAFQYSDLEKSGRRFITSCVALWDWRKVHNPDTYPLKENEKTGVCFWYVGLSVHTLVKGKAGLQKPTWLCEIERRCTSLKFLFQKGGRGLGSAWPQKTFDRPWESPAGLTGESLFLTKPVCKTGRGECFIRCTDTNAKFKRYMRVREIWCNQMNKINLW